MNARIKQKKVVINTKKILEIVIGTKKINKPVTKKFYFKVLLFIKN